VVVIVPVLLVLVMSGVGETLRYDLFVWPIERYIPFHGGVGWGAWLPSWSMLGQIPARWQVIAVPVFSIATCAVWVLPALPVLSSVLAMRKEEPVGGRRVLLLACAAIYLSAFPNGAAMRVVRLSIPFWPLLALELDRLLAVYAPRIVGIVTCAMSAFLL